MNNLLRCGVQLLNGLVEQPKLPDGNAGRVLFMKKFLTVATFGLLSFSLAANAQLFGLSIGRHGVSVGVGLPVPIYCAPPVVYSPPPVVYAPAVTYTTPTVTVAPTVPPAPMAYASPPMVTYTAPPVVYAAPAPVYYAPTYSGYYSAPAYRYSYCGPSVVIGPIGFRAGYWGGYRGGHHGGYGGGYHGHH